jgi:hypothetical protein
MAKKPAIVWLIIVFFVALAAFAEPREEESGDTPWLAGVDIPPVPSTPTPEFDVAIGLPDGAAIPATLTEDIPVTFRMISGIFGEQAPTSWQEQPLTGAAWSEKAEVNLYFNDLRKNTSSLASSTENGDFCFTVTPTHPFADGAVNVFLNRGLLYDEGAGVMRQIYATAGKGVNIKVLDITPPLCGLEITHSTDGTGSVWAVENPLNEYPLPKHADVVTTGALFSQSRDESQQTVSGLELGEKTILDQGRLAVFLPKRGSIKLASLVLDNDQVDEQTIRFGVCELVNGVPRVIGEENPATLDLTAVKWPREVYLFVLARDVSGNAGSLFIPVTLE